MKTEEEEERRVYISEYMKSRSYNKTLYARLVEAIEANCARLFKLYPNVEVRITMSAKYQTPMIIISERTAIPEKIGLFEQEIMEALDTVGFEYSDSGDDGSYYKMNFQD